MLVLGRLPGEKVCIRVGDVKIDVTYLRRTKGDTVWLGFEAPLSVEILRDDAVFLEPKKEQPNA